MEKFSIKHNLKIQEDGLTIKGQILDVEWGEFNRDCGYIVGKYGSLFSIESMDCPELHSDILFVFGEEKSEDLKIISYTYKSKEEAENMMNFINKYSSGYKEEILDCIGIKKEKNEWYKTFEKDGIKIEKDTITINDVAYTIDAFKEHYSKCSSALKKWNNEFKSL